MTTLPDLRMDLASAKTELRTAKDDLETAKTIATMNVVGKNDDERKRNAAQALRDDQAYQSKLFAVRAFENDIDEIEAAIDAAKDERTARELAIRERANEALDRYAAALERLARANPVHAAIDDHALRVARGDVPF